MVAAIAFESAGEAGRLHRGRPVRDLRHVQRLRRPLPPGAQRYPHRAAAHAVRRIRQLRELDLAHRALDARDHVPAAPVPGRGDRERRREASATPPSGCFRSTCSRSTSSCFPSPSAACCASPEGGVDADTFVLTLPMAEQQDGLRPARLHRRTVGGHRHGHRRDHRAFDHGLQRPGHAGAAAQPPPAPERAPRPVQSAARHPALGHRDHPDAGLPLLPAGRRSLRAGVDRPDLVRRRRAVRPGHPRRNLLERRHARGRARRHERAGSWSGPTPCSCRPSRARAGCRRAS